MVYGTQITIVTGVYQPIYNWGGPHCSNWFKKKLTAGGAHYWFMIPIPRFMILDYTVVDDNSNTYGLKNNLTDGGAHGMAIKILCIYYIYMCVFIL